MSDASTLKEDRYLFRQERLIAALTERTTGYFDENDGFHVVRDPLPGMAEGIVLSDYTLRTPELLASVVAAVGAADERFVPDPQGAAKAVTRSDLCEPTLRSLRARRDEVIRAIGDTRDYLFQEATFDQWGDLVVDADTTLDLLRPRLPEHESLRAPDPDRSPCTRCDYDTWAQGHQDWCEEISAATHRRREAAETAHIGCQEMAAALCEQIAAGLAQVEAVAASVFKHVADFGGPRMVAPHRLLPLAKVAHLAPTVAPGAPLTPGEVATAIEPPLVDPDYCGADDDYHVEPHRACRRLLE